MVSQSVHFKLSATLLALALLGGCGKKNKKAANDHVETLGEEGPIKKIGSIDLKNYVGIAFQSQKVQNSQRDPNSLPSYKLAFDRDIYGVKSDGKTEKLALELPNLRNGQALVDSIGETPKFFLLNLRSNSGVRGGEACLDALILKRTGFVYCVREDYASRNTEKVYWNEGATKFYYAARYSGQAYGIVEIDLSSEIPVLTKTKTAFLSNIAVNSSGDVLFIEPGIGDGEIGSTVYGYNPGSLRQASSSGNIDLGFSDAECLTSGMGDAKDSFFIKRGDKFRELKKIEGRYQLVGPGTDLPPNLGCSRLLQKTESEWFMSESHTRPNYNSSIVYRIERTGEGVFSVKSFTLPADERIANFVGKGNVAYVAHGPKTSWTQYFEITRINFASGTSSSMVPTGTYSLGETLDVLELYAMTVLPDDSLGYFVRVVKRDPIPSEPRSGQISQTTQSRAVQKIINNPEVDSVAVDGKIELEPMGVALQWESLACPSGQVRYHNVCQPTICTAKQVSTVSCAAGKPNVSVADFSRTCDKWGLSSSDSSCTVKSCVDGFHVVSNTCKAIVEPIKTVNGVTYTLTGPATVTANTCVAFTVTRNSVTSSQQDLYPGLKLGDGALYKDSSCSTIASLNTSIATGQTALTFYFMGLSAGETTIELFDLSDNTFGSTTVTIQE